MPDPASPAVLLVRHGQVDLERGAPVGGLGSEPVANLEGRWLTLDGGRLTGVDARGAAH